MSPGAYASITKVDFKTLDQLTIKPIGIYGCKDEIVRLLRFLGAVDEELYVILFLFLHALGSHIVLQGSLITRTKRRWWLPTETLIRSIYRDYRCQPNR